MRGELPRISPLGIAGAPVCRPAVMHRPLPLHVDLFQRQLAIRFGIWCDALELFHRLAIARFARRVQHPIVVDPPALAHVDDLADADVGVTPGGPSLRQVETEYRAP